MRKTIKSGLIIMMVFLLILGSACKTEIADQPNNSNDEISSNPVNATIAHGSPSGLWFMLASGVSESLGRTYKGSIMQLSPGDSISNFLRADEHTIDFGLTLTNTVYTGYNGFGFFDEKHTNTSGIAVFYPSMLQFIVEEDTEIDSFEDFINRKVPISLSIGTKGGGAHTTFVDTLAEYNLTLADLEGWGCKLYEKGIKDTGELLSDGIVDGIWAIAGAPTPIVVQSETKRDMKMIQLPQDLIDALINKYGFSNYVLPGGSYGFQTEDFTGVSVYTMLTASLDVSDETAYKVAKSLYENTEYFNTLHAALKKFSKENILNGMPIPLHPGAERYYKEIGLVD